MANNHRYYRDRNSYPFRKSSGSIPNYSGKVNGKDITFFDIDNLKKANVELEKSMKFYEKRAEEIRNIQKAQRELTRDEKSRFEMYTKNLDAINKKLISNDELMAKWPKHMRQMIQNPTDKDNILNDLIHQARSNRNNAPRNIQDAFRTQLDNSLKSQVNNAYSNIAKDVYDKYKRKGANFTDKETLAVINKEINDKTIEKINPLLDKYSSATNKFAIASNVFSSFTQIFKYWARIAGVGVNNQTGVFENTFENISVRNDISRKQYLGTQMKVNNTLSSMGLRNNIATSSVQQMWDTMATNGFVLDMSTEKAKAELTANAIDLVLTNRIVPYLDTTSQSFQILNSRLDNKFVKDIRGINIANNQIAGNNYITKDLLQTIIDQVQPMSDKALEDLAQGSTEVTAMINSLIENGVSPDAAKSYATRLFKTQRYSDQILKSGKLNEQISLIDSLNKGINIYDPTQWNDYIANAVNTDQYLAGMGPEYNSTMNGIIANVVGGATGVDYETYNGAKILTNKGISGTSLGNKTNLTDSQMRDFTNKITDSYARDKHQTQKRLQDITMENFMNEFAASKASLGHWGDIIVDAIKGVGSAVAGHLALSIVGKGIGALAGSAAGGTGAGILAAGTGGIALGAIGLTAAAVAVPALIATGITKYQDNKNNQENKDLPGKIKNKAQEYMNAGVDNEITAYAKALQESQATGNIGMWNADSEVGANFTKKAKLPNGSWYDKSTSMGDATSFTSGNKNILAAFTDLDKKTRESFGLNPNMFVEGEGEARTALERYRVNSDWKGYNKIKAYALANFVNHNKDQISMNAVAAAINIAALEQGIADKDFITEPMAAQLGLHMYTSIKDVNKFLADSGITEAAQLGDIYRMLGSKNVDFYLMNGKPDGWMTFPSNDTLKSKYNLHRYGLNEVPYDEYPALLHQGEAVLSATTATTLRSLISDYQETNKQTVSFDAIIQTQTATLVSKMDEIIKNMGNNLPAFNKSVDQRNANNKLVHSMTHLSSTKTF